MKQLDAMSLVQTAVQCCLHEEKAEAGMNGAQAQLDLCMAEMRCLVTGLDQLMVSSSQRLGVTEMYGVLAQANLLSSNVVLTQRLVELWSQRQLTAADQHCFVDTILCNESFTIPQRVPMLGTVLLGQGWKSMGALLTTVKQGSLASMLDVSGDRRIVSDLLESQLRSQGLQRDPDAASCTYEPHWIKELFGICLLARSESELSQSSAAVDAVEAAPVSAACGGAKAAPADKSEDQPEVAALSHSQTFSASPEPVKVDVFPVASAAMQLADCFFHLVWEWLLLRHSQDDLNELAGLADELEPNERDSAAIQRKIMIAAVHVLIINRLAGRIVHNPHDEALLVGVDQSEHEADRMSDQLQRLSGSQFSEGWATELAYAVCKESGGVEAACQLLESRAAFEDTHNVIVAQSLREAKDAMGDDPEAWIVQFGAKRPPLDVPSLQRQQQWDGSHMHLLEDQADTVELGPFVKALVSERRNLRSIWMMPDLLEFYRWITSELSKSPTAEVYVQTMKMESFMDRNAGSEDVDYY